jgi:O-antigen/teichoic acid export membrane protein
MKLITLILNKLRSTPLVYSFAKNSFWSILGSLFSKGINFFCIITLAKFLGPESFGEYNVVQITIGVFGTLAGTGLGMAATKLIAEWKTKSKHRIGELVGTLYGLSFLTSTVVTIIFFLLSSKLAFSFQANMQLIFLFQITSFVVIFDSIGGIQFGIILGLEKFKLLSIINIIQGIITMPILLVGAFKYGLVGLTVMMLVTKIITYIIYEYFIRRELKTQNIKISIKYNKDIISEIYKIGIPAFLGGLSQTPVSWYTNYLLANQPLGFKSLGIYNTANQLRTFVLFLPDSAGRISIPMLSSAFGEQNLKKFKSTAIVTILWNFFLSVISAIFILVFATFFKDMLGEKYNFNASLIIVILLTGVSIAASNAMGYIFICSNKTWLDLYFRIVSGISIVCIIFFWGRYNGAYGYASGYLYGTIFYLVLQVLYLLRLKSLTK